MSRKISEDIINKIPLLYKQYGVKKKVAEELGISVSTVSKYLTLFEAAPQEDKVKEEKKAKIKVTDELIQKINDEYAICKNMSQVARNLGISPSTVKKYLNEDNLKLKSSLNDDRDALWYYIFRLFG